ncbi:MAG TPA: hypothetical protein VFQ35_11555 [Polyangiaceae bacterium]|nr:hypothetical protein [Polyangiaceae bacterium]
MRRWLFTRTTRLTKSMKWVLPAATVMLCLLGAFLAGKSFAAGIPPTGALTYSGLLQDAGGQPLAGPQFVEVKLWNHPSANANTNLLCDSGTPASVQLVSGHFSLVLPDTCSTAVAANPDVYTEVFVGASAAGAASLGRSKLGAVPYAISAENSTRATVASTADTANVASSFAARTKPFPGATPSATTAYKLQSGSTVAKIEANGRVRIPFVEAFPKGLVSVVATDSYAGSRPVFGLDDDEDLTGFTVIGTPNATIRVNWIAIGW